MSPLLLTSADADKEAFARRIQAASDAVRDALSDPGAYAGASPQDLSRLIASYEVLPEHGLGFEGMMRNVRAAILPNFLRTSSAGYMAHLHSPALLDSLASELILSSFNQSMDSWDQSPVATETELSVVRCLCALFGYGAGADGCFTSGGSQSNLTGILLARDWFCTERLHHDVRASGLPAEYARLRLYASEASHFSMEKSCHLLGLGYGAVVPVPVDARQKMDTAALRALLEKDRAAGNLPFCIVATIGTTDYGSIDDVAALRALAGEYGAWLHADAAYGGALVLSPAYRERMGNLALCDSVTVDFHKMFLLPISCSAVLVREARSFEPLEFHAEYLNRREDEDDGYTNLVGKSIQTTRRFDALKVWMAFQSYGRDGYARIIGTCVENAAYLYERLCERAAFVPALRPEISSVVFRVRPGGSPEDGERSDALNKGIRRALLHKEGIVIGQTAYAGRTHLKCTLLNPTVTHRDLDGLLDTVERLARQG